MKHRINDPVLRWSIALIWTGLILLLMLTPSDQPVVEDTSATFGGTDFTDAVGHVVLFGALALFWWAALTYSREYSTAHNLGLGLALLLGIALEIAQHWIPERGTSLLDLGANIGGVFGLALIYRTFPTWLTTLIKGGKP